MQRAGLLPNTHPLMGIQAVSKAIALPGMHTPQRYPTFPALERTAVLGFSVPTTVNLPASSTTQLLLFRQAAYPFWGYTSLAAQVYAKLSWTADGPDNTVNAVLSMSMPVTDTLSEYSTAVVAQTAGRIGVTTPVSTYPLNNAAPVIGRDGSHFIYIPPNTSWSVIVTSRTLTAITSEVTVNLQEWVSPGECQEFSLADFAYGANVYGATSPIVVNGLNGRWIRPAHVSVVFASNSIPYESVEVAIVWSTRGHSYTPNNNGRGNIGLNSGSALTTLFPLAEPTEFLNSKLPWFATRTTAASLLGTNVTQLLNKGGTVLAGRFSPNVQHPWSVTSAQINALHPAEKAFLPLETGVYTYVPPSTDLQEFYDYTSVQSPNAAAAPVHNLANNALYNVVNITATSVAETLACTVDWHIEFRTSSALFNIGTTAMSLEGLHQAQLILNELGFFFENPNHKTILMTLVDKAKKYLPKAIGMINPVAGRVAKSVVKYVDRNAIVQIPRTKYNRMRTTNARASGYQGPSRQKKVKVQQQKPQSQKKKGGLDMYLESRNK